MRSYLNNGTLIKVSGGILYKITGEPIGEGGGSVIYPALRMLPDENGYKTSRILYAVKECYPQTDRFEFTRNAYGEICASSDDPEAGMYLERAKAMQEKEEFASGKIYAQAFRLTPILESYRQVELSINAGKDFHSVRNMISIMESLSEKGESLKHCLADQKYLKVRDAFDVIRQVLLAVGEIHKSGFLHLDIQDGNVFMKGVLDRNDRMISLVDFGSARPLLSDGLSPEITDKVLYSTRGFSAPEILLKNDGHLRLGKQADIYSIGVLTLLLLTGHRYLTTELMANKDGKFIPRFAIRKTGCPAHWIEKMQKIVAKALASEPALRYESCDCMLADVDELLALIAPHTDPLSATDYDAFICYKHSKKDNAAAKMLRDSLEHYRGSFRSKRRINRVFLDEGEFSSCSDFGERINTALKNSKWLIVLCSRQTRDSVWVNEEIRAFLKKHDKSRVLAVITEGEPEEVYPEELLKNGLSSKTLFAADARAESEQGVLKRIKGDVCLQIAAPILETTFDALKQRDRTYRMQRIFIACVIVLCALLGFISYAAIKNRLIAKQEQLIAKEQNEKLESQAGLLAKQAEDAYNSGDYVNAIKLALSSMELSTANKELQSELKGVLVSCLNLYVRPEEAAQLPIPTGMIREPDGSDDPVVFLNSESSRLFLLTDQAFSTWDTGDCSLVSRFEAASSILYYYPFERKDYLIEDQQYYILCTEDALICYAYETGKVVWEKQLDHTEYMKNLVFSPDQKYLFYFSDSAEPEKVVIEALDPATGEIRNKYMFDRTPGSMGHVRAVSQDNRYIACVGDVSEDLKEFKEVLCIFDLENETSTETVMGSANPWGSEKTAGILFTNDSRVILSRYDGSVNIRSSLDDEHSADIIGRKNFVIRCFDYLNGEFIWQYPADNTGEADNPASEMDLRNLRIPVLYRTQITEANVLLAGVDNTLLILQEENGQLIKEMLLDSAILSITEQEGHYQLILENGDIVKIKTDLDSEDLRRIRSFPGDVQLSCDADPCFYILSQSNPDTVVKYELGKYDNSYSETFVDGVSASEYVKALVQDDRSSESKGVRLEIEKNENSFKIIGGDQQEVEVGEPIQVLSFIPDSDRIFVGLRNQIRIYDLNGTLVAKQELPTEVDSLLTERIRLFFPEDGASFYGDGQTGFLLDLNENSISIIKYLKNVAGFEHDKKSFIICNSLSDEKDGCTVGHIKYHTLDEIRELASQTIS